MIIVIGRAMLFVNMTAGKPYLQNLIEHNLDQARDRMAEWSAGLSIKGANEWKTFDIKWTDIDYVAVISVVDGPHSACVYHDLPGLNFDLKVRLCATVTAKIMSALARRGGGARDLLTFCQSLRGMPSMSEPDGIAMLDRQYRAATRREIPTVPRLFGTAWVDGKQLSLFDQFMNNLVMMRRQPGINTDAFSDLNWSNVADAAAFLTNSTAGMENVQNAVIGLAHFGNETRFSTIISTSMEVLAKQLAQLLDQTKRAGSQFVFLVSLLSLGPSITILYLEHSDGAKATEAFLAAQQT